MNRSVFSLAFGVLVSASVHAASLTISIDGNPQVLQLQALSVDSEGNVNVKATSSAGTGGTDSGTGGTDSGTGGTDSGTGGTDSGTGGTDSGTGGTGNGTGAACVSGPNLVCIDTKLPTTPLSRVGYRPDPKQVFAFKVVVPAGARYGSASATVQTGSMSAKLLVISETPGDTDTTLTSTKTRGCVAQGTESSRINMAFDPKADVSGLVYCKLEAGKTYYINASSYSKWGSGTTCTSASSCGFYFEGR